MSAIDRRELGLAFLGLAASLLAPFEPAAAAEPPGPWDVVVRANVMVAMRDGVKLATDLYLPARGGVAAQGRFPVILERTPYGKSQATTRHASAEIARLFASHGYAVVYQDVRGRGGSAGAYVQYLSDGNDGFDCCA
ncbi:MAG TPA: CocE/NonD family hydrolase, partial [Phenylobacterium sp.]